MELAKLIEGKKEEVQGLEQRLRRLKGDLEATKEKYPPLWSGRVKDLSKFTADLEEWLKSPKVKRARDLIEELKKEARDNRSFKGLSEDYLMDVMTNLEDGTALLSQIENDSLRAKAAKRILDTLQDQVDIGGLVSTIQNYFNSFREFVATEVQDGFSKAVKRDLLASLSEPEHFSTDQVVEAKGVLEKASKAVQLLSGSGIGIKAYIGAYKNLKSVDSVWEYADRIRELLIATNFRFAPQVGEPFREIIGILDQRAKSIANEDLIEIWKGLEEVRTNVEKWKSRVRASFEQEHGKAQALAGFAKLENGLQGLLEEFTEKLEHSLSIEEICQIYQRLQEIKRNAMAALEGKVSENERRIIENMDRADELAEEMGNDFWRALKSLRSQRLIKVTIKRSE
jgi:hypothetical protein